MSPAIARGALVLGALMLASPVAFGADDGGIDAAVDQVDMELVGIQPSTTPSRFACGDSGKNGDAGALPIPFLVPFGALLWRRRGGKSSCART